MSVVGEAAKAVSDAVRFAEGFATEWCAHHPNDKLVRVCDGKVELIVQEVIQGLLTKEEIRMTVVVSPDNKLNDKNVEAEADHAGKAHTACLKKLSEMAFSMYHIM